MDWFVAELVTRLPFKSLYRFKTVSKNWLSLIDSHIAFSKTRLPCRLVIVHPLPDTYDSNSPWEDWPPWEDREGWPEIRKHAFITCDVLFEDKQLVVVDTIQEVDSSSNYCNIILKPANGLMCFIDSNIAFVPRIWNVSTRELSSCMLIKFKNRMVCPRNIRMLPQCPSLKFLPSAYGFGFDPVTNTHKVVCVWWVGPAPADGGVRFCYVLTDGERKGYNENSTWRKIETAPYVSNLTEVSIYVNGFIYWTTSRPLSLVAFDVRSEKFIAITIPDFILDLPRYPIEHSYNSNDHRLVDLLEVGGNLAMSIKMTNKMYKIFIYCDVDGSWTEVNIVLPFDLEKDQHVKFLGYGSNEKIIVILTTKGRVCGKEVGKGRCVSIYCYDWEKDSWFEFEVNGIPLTLPHLCRDRFFTTFSPSLLAP